MRMTPEAYQEYKNRRAKQCADIDALDHDLKQADATINAAAEGTRTRKDRGGVVPVPIPSAAAPYPLVSLCRAMRLPEPVPEYAFCSYRKWRADYAWPLHMLLLEVEGGIWTQGRHTRGKGALADLEKYSEAAILGWRIIYCTPDDLMTLGIDRVRKALAMTRQAA